MVHGITTYLLNQVLVFFCSINMPRSQSLLEGATWNKEKHEEANTRYANFWYHNFPFSIVKEP